MDGSLRGLVEVRAPVALESGRDAGARSFREVLARLVREPLVLFVNAVVLVAAFALALGVARSSGGSSRSVALVGAVALFVAFPNSVARTQVFAFLFFVAVFALLAWDSRAASRRVFLVLPLLVLWANVHGSAVLGAGLVVLAALASVVRAVRRPGVGKIVLRAAVLALATPICLLASPYAFDLPSYYRAVLSSP